MKAPNDRRRHEKLMIRHLKRLIFSAFFAFTSVLVIFVSLFRLDFSVVVVGVFIAAYLSGKSIQHYEAFNYHRRSAKTAPEYGPCPHSGYPDQLPH